MSESSESPSSPLPTGVKAISEPLCLPPPNIPDHELIKRIGQGAYGEVWIARSVTGAFRAVKIVRRSSFDHDRPFEREFEGIQKFEPVSRTHESQVDILHVGRGTDYFYYVMELADDQATGGQIHPENYHPRTLKSDLLFRSRLSFEECVSVGIALTTALEHLHSNGLVHRDVKPSNIIFINGVAKLADIGLVTGLDTTRSYVGTEGFAAPEGPGTVKADIFSLGKVVYEMSTGKDRQDFPELPTDLRELPDRDGLVELNAVVARACRHNPEDRYANAAEMRKELGMLQSGKSLAKLRRVERQLRVLRRTGAAIGALALLVLSGWFYQVRQTGIMRELADRNSRLAQEKTKLADENRERLTRLNIANGVRLMDSGDISGGLVWFAEALPLVTNNPAAEEIHRIRIQQALNQTPRLLQVIAEKDNLRSCAYSPDGTRMVTGFETGVVRVRNRKSAEIIWEWRGKEEDRIQQLRYSHDGRKILLSSARNQGSAGKYKSESNFLGMLDAESGKLVHVFRSGEGISNITFSTFSPDDRWAGAAGADHVIRIFNTQNGALLAELRGHTNKIRMIEFSKDGSLVVSASKDKTARIWHLPDGESLIKPIVHEEPLIRVALSPDGSLIATSCGATQGSDGRSASNLLVQTWNVRTGARVGAPISVQESVLMMVFTHPNGNNLVIGGSEVTAQALDPFTHEERFAGLKTEGHASSWAFSSDGRRMAIGTVEGAVHIWDMLTGELRFQPFRHTGRMEGLSFSPDDQHLLSVSDDGTVKEWNLTEFSETAVKKLPKGALTVDFENWTQLPGHITVEVGPVIYLLDPSSLAEEHRLVASRTNSARYEHVAHPNGRAWLMYEVLAGDEGNSYTPCVVDLWRENEHAIQHLSLEHPSAVRCASFNVDCTELSSFCLDNKIRIWKLSDGSLASSFTPPCSDFSGINFLPDSRRSFVAFKDGTAALMDLVKGMTLSKLPRHDLHGDESSMLSNFDAGLNRVIICSGQEAAIWDLTTGRPIIPLIKNGSHITSPSFSPDGNRLLLPGWFNEIKIWDARTGEMVCHPLHLDGNGRLGTWSKDSRFIATRSHEHSARVWDSVNAEAITPLIRHREPLYYVSVSLQGRLITSTDNNIIRSWELSATKLPPQLILDHARVLSGRKLSAGGALIALGPSEYEELFRKVRKQAPALFETRR
jgi:WD40 repeat protein